MWETIYTVCAIGLKLQIQRLRSIEISSFEFTSEISIKSMSVRDLNLFLSFNPLLLSCQLTAMFPLCQLIKKTLQKQKKSPFSYPPHWQQITLVCWTLRQWGTFWGNVLIRIICHLSDLVAHSSARLKGFTKTHCEVIIILKVHLSLNCSQVVACDVDRLRWKEEYFWHLGMY